MSISAAISQQALKVEKMGAGGESGSTWFCVTALRGKEQKTSNLVRVQEKTSRQETISSESYVLG